MYIPREAKRPEREAMTREEVKQLFAALDTRERLIAQLAIYRGMRPGEILALTWGSLTGESVEITRRLYSSELETPKSHRGTREAALSDGLVKAIEKWRHFLPKLKPVGLEWATFQVMRRTNSSLVNKSKIDPKVGADQRGHGIGVSLAVYTQSDREEKRAAVNPLEAALA